MANYKGRLPGAKNKYKKAISLKTVSKVEEITISQLYRILKEENLTLEEYVLKKLKEYRKAYLAD